MANPHDALWNRIRAGCVWVGACLVWQGYTSGGYGVITFKYKKFIVHRAVYEYFKGPIPKGFVVDHVAANGCRNKACCNIDHLEAVTRSENTKRWASQPRKTHCKRGHVLTGENVDATKLRLFGAKECRVCRAILRHARNERLKTSPTPL